MLLPTVRLLCLRFVAILSPKYPSALNQTPLTECGFGERYTCCCLDHSCVCRCIPYVLSFFKKNRHIKIPSLVYLFPEYLLFFLQKNQKAYDLHQAAAPVPVPAVPMRHAM